MWVREREWHGTTEQLERRLIAFWNKLYTFKRIHHSTCCKRLQAFNPDNSVRSRGHDGSYFLDEVGAPRGCEDSVKERL
jgi:hypothetical protein